MSSIKIFYLTICAFGFGLATNLQVANLSTILQFSGFKSYLITYLWLIAPITGMISQPIIGILSDHMHTRFGRRKPLFLISTLLGVSSLMCLPFTHNTFFIVCLIIFLDIGANGNAQLSRILILDTATKNERTKAFCWSSALGGVGALSAGIFPWILINIFKCSSIAEGPNHLPHYVYVTFIIGAALYLITSLITLIMIKEKKAIINLQSHESFLQKLIIVNKTLAGSFKNFPINFWKLSLILFFAWIGIFAVWNYLNIDIAQTVFHMPIHLTDNLLWSGDYLTEANVWTSNYFGILQLSSTLFALAIPSLNRYIPLNRIFAFGLGVGSLSLIAIACSSSKLLIAMYVFFYGLSWATVSTCPYAIFADMMPTKNNGYHMGVFNVVIVLPQILTGLTLGYIYKNLFMFNAALVIQFAGACLFVSMIICARSYFGSQKTSLNLNTVISNRLKHFRFKKKIVIKDNSVNDNLTNMS